MKNPFINALLAEVYIVAVVLTVHYGSKIFGETDALVIPIAMLSLFVFSVVVMGFLFVYRPLRLYTDGAKEESIRHLVKTALSFAGITILIFSVIISVIMI